MGQCGEELRYLKDHMKIMEATLSAMGITLPVPQDQPTDVGSSHNEIHSHHDNHSDHEIGISLQPQPHLQQQPSPHHGAVQVSRSGHSDHEEIGPSLHPQPQPSPHIEVDRVTSSIPHHSSREALREELASAECRAEEECDAHNATNMASPEREVELEHRAVEASNALARLQTSSKKKRKGLRSGIVTKVCRNNP